MNQCPCRPPAEGGDSGAGDSVNHLVMYSYVRATSGLVCGYMEWGHWKRDLRSEEIPTQHSYSRHSSCDAKQLQPSVHQPKSLMTTFPSNEGVQASICMSPALQMYAFYPLHVPLILEYYVALKSRSKFHASGCLVLFQAFRLYEPGRHGPRLAHARMDPCPSCVELPCCSMTMRTHAAMEPHGNSWGCSLVGPWRPDMQASPG